MVFKQNFKQFLKKLESRNRVILYSILKLVLRTPEIKPPVDISKIKKILILRYDAIGDMIVTLPTISLIKNKIPNAEIHVLASKRNFQIIENDKRISKIFIHSGIPHKVFSEFWHLRKEKYDLVLSFVFSKTTFSGIISNLTGRNSIKVNPLEENRSHLYSALFNMQVPISELRDQVTMVEILSNIVCKIFVLKYDPAMLENKIYIEANKNEDTSNFFNLYTDYFKIFYNLSSGNEYRKLNYEQNQNVIEHILKRNPKYLIILIFSPEDKETAILLSSYFKERVVMLPETKSICDLIAASSKADIFITPDTSIVHVAASANKPVLVLYSKMASFIREWMPYNVPYIAVVTKEKLPLDSLSTEEITTGFDKLIEKINN